jgi:hypothetical protein
MLLRRKGVSANHKTDQNSGKDNAGGGDLSVTEHDSQVGSFVTGTLLQQIQLQHTERFNLYTGKDRANKWFTVSYTGNDKAGYANYNVSIDVSSYSSYLNPANAYIMKRADESMGMCEYNQFGFGNNSFRIDTFSDFAVAFIPNDVSVTANVAPTGSYTDCPFHTHAPKATIRTLEQNTDTI